MKHLLIISSLVALSPIAIHASHEKQIPIKNFWHGVDQEELRTQVMQTLNLEANEFTNIIAFWKAKYQGIDNWACHYPIVTDVIRVHGGRVGCEIGSAFGTQSEHILANTNVELLYSIDPYIPYDNGVFPKQATQKRMDVLAQIVEARLKQFEKRSQLIRKTSIDASQDFPDNSLDFVYIDGDHSYKAVSTDLQAWWPKIRPGGILIGDDYNHKSHPGTKKAVDEFIRNNQLKLVTKKGCKYIVVKK